MLSSIFNQINVSSDFEPCFAYFSVVYLSDPSAEIFLKINPAKQKMWMTSR